MQSAHTRGVWGSCACVATTAGYLSAIVAWGWQAPIASTISLAIVAGVVVALFKVDDGLGAVPEVAQVAIATGLVIPAVAGLVVAFGLAGLLLALVLAATKPGLAALLRKRQHDAGEPRAAAAADPSTVRAPASWDEVAVKQRRPEARQDLMALDDDALCLAWRRSFLMLKAAASSADRLFVVEQRQAYLDELQRRSPRGLATWLASGARASGNPRPYLRDRGDRAC